MVRVRCGHARGGAAARRLRRSAAAFQRALGAAGSELSILLVGDAAIRRLNREWRGVDAATDVLSFPAAPAPGAAILGDVVLSLDTARRRARRGGRGLAAELDRTLAHGLLHLLGHDHERPAQARRMAEAERRLLAEQGMVEEVTGLGSGSRSGLASGSRLRSGSRSRSRSGSRSP
jgi:probable rRNA maturation factor